MALVGEAEVIATLNTDEVNAKVASLEGEGDLGLGGLGAGAAVAGEDAGKDITKGVEDETSKLGPALAEDGAMAGVGLRTGVTSETDKLADDVGNDADEAGERLEKGVGSHVSGLKSMLSGLGIPESLLSGPAIAAEAFGGLTIEAFHLQNQMQDATTAIATTEGIGVKAANEIGSAFLKMRGEFSGKEIAQAFGTVAGQLKSVDGQALTTAQSVKFMATTAQLATAAHTNLGDATTQVANILQAYTLNSKDAGNVSTYLFNAANATGIGLDGVGAALTKVKSTLGGLAPPLKDTTGLLLDLTDHGETGRKAVSALSTGFTAFLKPVTDQITAQKNYKIALDQLPPSLRGIAEASINNAGAASQLYKMTENMSSANQSAVSNFQSAAEAMTTSKDAADKLGFSITNAKTGALLPMSQIIGKLHDQIEGMGKVQATATLSADGFGSSAARWVKTVQAGPAAFSKATEAVSKHNAVEKAAAEQSKTFDVALKTLEASGENIAIEFGQEVAPVFHDVLNVVEDLAPYVEEVLGVAFKILGEVIGKTTTVFKDVVEWFKKGSAEAKIVGAVIGVALTPMFVRLGIEAVKALGRAAASAVEWAGKTVAQIGRVLTGNFSLRSSMEETAATSDETTGSLEADAAAQEVALEGVSDAEISLGETSEAVAPEVDAALGPIGIAIGVIAIAALLLKDHWREVWSVMKETAEDAWHFIDGDVIHPIETAFKDVVDFIKSHWQLLVGIIGGPLVAAALLIYHFRADILKAFKDIIGDMEKIGEDIVKGLVNGIKEAGHLAADAAKDVAHGVEDGVKDVLHIFSPSQAFHEIGGNIVQGLADGIKDHSAIAEQAARTMSGKVRDAASGKGSGGLGGGGGATLIIHMEEGAIKITATNTDEKKTLAMIEDGLEMAFRKLNVELGAGISQLSHKVSA